MPGYDRYEVTIPRYIGKIGVFGEREVTSGNFEFRGQAAAIALNSGASAELSTGGGGRTSVTAANGEITEVDSSGFYKGMAVFTLSQGGFMVEVSLGGQKFSYEPL